eukprot:433740-Hanusia_phi.AAC.1
MLSDDHIAMDWQKHVRRSLLAERELLQFHPPDSFYLPLISLPRSTSLNLPLPPLPPSTSLCLIPPPAPPVL